MTPFIHNLADVEIGAEIGEGTKIWRWTHIMPEARIGCNCVISENCFIDDGVDIGNNCHIQNSVNLYNGVVLRDNVFVGPGVVFMNVRKPKANASIATSCYSKTVVNKNVSIGANATIMCGIDIGENSLIGAGAVITKNVPPGVTVIGNPAGILVTDITGTSFVINYEQYYISKKLK